MGQKFLTSAELGITEEERTGLIQLEQHFREDLCTIPSGDLAMGFRTRFMACQKDARILGFSMSRGAALAIWDKRMNYDCGCVACIGGHLSLILQGEDVNQESFSIDKLRDADRYVLGIEYKSTPLYRLFYPSTAGISSYHWDRITPAIAADGVLNFLETGDPNWKGLAEKHGIPREVIETR